MGCLFSSVWVVCLVVYGLFVWQCMDCLFSSVWVVCLVVYGLFV